MGCVVAIDGPSGVGKSTVSHKLARALNGMLLDTGAMYRAVAYYAIKEGTQEESALGLIARSLKFEVDPESSVLLVNGVNLGAKIRTEKVSQMASKVSQFASVREALTKKQRSLGKKLSKSIPVVVEGRDIGSVVFPDVQFKFFITADEMERARRRFHQMRDQGHKVTLEEILAQQRERDHRDSTRKLAPLKKSADAVVVNTSSMDEQSVVTFLKEHIEGHLFEGGRRSKVPKQIH